MPETRKLTWDYLSPAPFESAWSTYYKLLALNHISPSQLAEVIGNGSHNDYLDFRRADGVDFARYTDLLGVEEDRLKSGFLDLLGFPIIEQGADWGIRHCPKCMEVGYHCVFFDLGIVAECPWHRVALIGPCRSCADAIRFNGLRHPEYWGRGRTVTKADSEAARFINRFAFHSKCGHLAFNPAIPQHRNDCDGIKELHEKIRASCTGFLEWWMVRGRVGASGAQIWAPLAVTADISDGRFGDSIALYLGVAEAHAGRCPWSTSVSPIKGRWSSFEDRRSCAQCSTIGSVRTAFSSPAGLIYKSIRRHFYRHYVRRHCKCWNLVRSMVDEQALSLDGMVACVISIAFVTWELGTRGVVARDVLRGKWAQYSPIVPALMVDDAGRGMQRLFHLWYASFFWIWHKIERDSREGNVRITIGDQSLLGSSVFDAGATQTLRFGGEHDRSAFVGGHRWVVFPDPHGLGMRALARCLQRPPGAQAMMANGSGATAWFVSTASQSGAGHTVFVLRHRMSHLARRFKDIVWAAEQVAGF